MTVEMVDTPMRVCLMGAGEVGGGVVTMLAQLPNAFTIDLILVKNLQKERDFIIPSKTRVTDQVDDVKVVLEGRGVDILVDCMGGVDEAWTCLEIALRNTIHVVSANKACLATMLPEIEQLYAKRGGPQLHIEAAVAGGVPIIATLRRSMAFDTVTKVGGVMNGTTNYILTAMQKEGRGYEEVLEEAQRQGYAEATPDADVDGLDARHKLILLSRIAFGVVLGNDEVPTIGIRNVTDEDFAYAKLTGCTIKLLAEAELVDGVLYAFVSPVLLSLTEPLASCNGVANEVVLSTTNCGRIATNGAGAGRWPTANSVVSDILEILRSPKGTDCHKHPWDGSLTRSPVALAKCAKKSKYYVRITVKDHVGVIAEVAQVFNQYNVSIHSILQTPIEDHSRITFAVISEESDAKSIYEVARSLRCEVTNQPVGCFPYRG